jgi:uncharacterized membrane protein
MTLSSCVRSYLAGMRDGVLPTWKLRPGRLWEVDALRGIAIWMMVVYHLLWNLNDFAGQGFDLDTGFWGLWQVATAGLFTMLVGVSLTLSYHREGERHPTGSLWGEYAIRGATIFNWGLLVSLATYIVLGPEDYVRFGILHLIGVSVAIAYPLLRFRWLNLGLAAVVIGLGSAIRAVSPDIPWLEWLAFTPGSGMDYAPLLPTFSRVLIGIFLGSMLYPKGARRSGSSALSGTLSGSAAIKTLRRMGQNSLLIYLAHQPILIGLLFLGGVAR